MQSSDRDNLIIGASAETVHGVRSAAQVHVFPVGRTGPKASGSRVLHLDSRGVKGKTSANAGFGEGLA